MDGFVSNFRLGRLLATDLGCLVLPAIFFLSWSLYSLGGVQLQRFDGGGGAVAFCLSERAGRFSFFVFFFCATFKR